MTANVVCPGPTETPLLNGMVGDDERGTKVIAAMTRAVPMKRLGTLQDVADACLYLGSRAAAYVSGTIIAADGGWSLRGAPLG